MNVGRLAILQGNVETSREKTGKTDQDPTHTRGERRRKSTKGAMKAIVIAATEAEKNVREN